MAGHLLQLKLQSIRNGARRDSQHRRAWVGTLLFSILAAVFAVLAVVSTLDSDVEAKREGAIIVGSLVTIATGLVSVFVTPIAAIDPRSLAVMGFSPRRSAWLALSTALISVPSFALTVVLLVGLLLWAGDGTGLLVGVIGAALILATLVVLSRLAGLVGEDLRARRLVSDARAALVLVLLLLASPLVFVVVAVDWELGQHEAVSTALEVLSLSPLAAPWAAAASATGGDLQLALLQLGIGAATLVVLLVLWQVVAGRVASAALGGDETELVDLGGFGTFGRSPALVVAARTVTYWMRDPRYVVVNVSIILIPLLALIPLAVVGVEPRHLALLPLPLLAFFIGWTLHNDLAFDGSAVWMHVTSGMSGLSDRFGRALPTLVFGSVVVLLGAVVTWLIVGDWGTILALVGVSLGLLFSATGFSSIGSVLHPYPVARPGDSPFSQPVRSWGSGVFWHPTTGFIAILLMGPAVYAGLVALNGGASWWNFVALGWGLVIGLIVLVVGLLAGARQFERRSSEIMAFAQSA